MTEEEQRMRADLSDIVRAIRFLDRTPYGGDAAAENKELSAELRGLYVERARYRAALHRIAKWFGEFPETGETWATSGEPVSYGAMYGSNGERDYMRKVAAVALNPEQAEPSPNCIRFSGCHDGRHDWSCPVEDE